MDPAISVSHPRLADFLDPVLESGPEGPRAASPHIFFQLKYVEYTGVYWRVWAMPIVIFLIGIAGRATSPLSSPHLPMDHVL
jgi:hypothetical protein